MRNIVNFILGLILGIVLSSSVVYAITLYQANEVKYDNTSSSSTSDTVQSALDDLYEKIDSLYTQEEVDQIIAGNTRQKIYVLGTGSSFDVSSYDGYENFTADNFLIRTMSGGGNLISVSIGNNDMVDF